MNEGAREQIVQRLWPRGAASSSVWAVLDGARDPAVHAALLQSRLEVRCLYAGPLARELEMSAPQLIELPFGHAFVHRLLDAGWGRSWGCYLSIADASNLRHHLRKFLKVRTEAGKTLLFRYYDPRVLRVFLPSCEPGELSAFFGPIERFIVETEDGESLVEYAQSRGRLLQTRHAAMVTP